MARKSKSSKPQRPEANAPVTRPLEGARPAQGTLQETGASQAAGTWRSGVALPAVASALALWAAFPPLSWGWIAWFAPLGWLRIAARETPVGRRGYFTLWLSGCVFWLLILQGVRLAYWPLYFGWLAISLYLAVYIPLFVGATRLLHWRWRLPLIVAAPLAWVGLEQVRSYLLTGFAANTLAHTQAHYPLVIQIADQLGGGGIAWVLMTAAVAILQLGRGLQEKQLVRQLPAVGWAVILAAALLGYGRWRLAEGQRLQAGAEPLLRVLLVQENTPSMFDNYSPQRSQQAWTSYLNLTRQATREHGPADLVVWPESTFTANEPWAAAQLDEGLPAELQQQPGVDADRLLAWVEDLQRAFHYKTQLVLAAARGLELGSDWPPADAGPDREGEGEGPSLLLGSDAFVYSSDAVEHYNTALLVGPQGQLLGRYDKMHLVMFGEYIPLGPVLQWLGDAVGLSGTDPGKASKSFPVAGARVAPNICFESMMPHFISRQVRDLTARGQAPDLLINLTNDSWFRGSSILDHHLACSILCAVENRRPLLVAANTGLSAHIDGSGRLLQCSPRLQAAAIWAEPYADARPGLVQWLGYPLSWLAAGLTVLAFLSSLGWRRGQGE